MAKASPIEEFGSDPQGWFIEVLRVRFEEVLRFIPPALDASGTDGVHDARVALRRLRSILRDFPDAAEKRSVKRLGRSLKRLGRVLGKVRDLDVLIKALEGAGDGDTPDAVRAGIARLIDRSTEERARRHRELADFLTEELVHDLRARLEAVSASAARRRILDEFPGVDELGSRIIAANIKRFRRRADAIWQPLATDRLHKMRLAAKRLRYSMELFSPHFDGPLDEFISQVKKMQSHLGRLHDRDTWCGNLGEYVSDEEIRDAALWLIAEFTTARSKAYGLALELWAEWERQRFSEALSESLVRRR